MWVILVSAVVGVSYFSGCLIGHKLFLRKFGKKMSCRFNPLNF